MLLTVNLKYSGFSKRLKEVKHENARSDGLW